MLFFCEGNFQVVMCCRWKNVITKNKKSRAVKLLIISHQVMKINGKSLYFYTRLSLKFYPF